jgi:hypothetical protein
VEESGEVEDVRPEEYTAGGASSDWEAEKPLESTCFDSSPEPASISDLSEGGEEDAGEDCEGDESHGEAVEGGEWAERKRAAFAEDDEEEKMQEKGKIDVT